MIKSSNYMMLVLNIFMIMIIGSFSSCQTKTSSKLIIATAANAQYAINTIRKEFTKDTGIDTEIIISSSGKHTAQIEAGAPYDIFISADLKYPEVLYRKGLTTSAPKVYAYGKLVIWSLNDTIDVSLRGITQPTLNHIAMPNPKTAPYGRAAKEALTFYKRYNIIEPKLVFGSSVAQTNQFILSNTADLGFTAASVVMAPAMKDNGHWQEVDQSTYTPIAQGAVVLKASTFPVQAQQFYNYLYSAKAQKILSEYGYNLVAAKK